MPSLVSSGRAGAGVVIFVAVLAATLDAALAVRSFAGGKILNAKLSTETEVNYESFSLRLRGGHCRTTTRQTSYKIPRQTEHQKKNEAITSTRRPCSGPWKISGVERYHGPDVVRAALWGASPRDLYHDPRTAARRIGFRLSRMDTNKPFSLSQPADINIALLKVAHRGETNLLPALAEAGADLDYMALRHTGAPMELVGLTPIAAAAHQGHVETVKILYALGANAVIADSEDREANEGKMASKSKVKRCEDLWLEISKAVAAKRRAVKKAEHTKMIPYTGNNRRTPGKRKTRHAKGARGGCH
mmetsp:Transcript_23717/g.56587  ORF Transcript_23717/g.56587 Transcript_23717/m.56587 type:complete len:303 (+) Transcript_23717:145-1053(+)